MDMFFPTGIKDKIQTKHAVPDDIKYTNRMWKKDKTDRNSDMRKDQKYP